LALSIDLEHFAGPVSEKYRRSRRAGGATGNR